MIEWLTQTSDQVPTHLRWLSRDERLRYISLASEKRRDDWLLGRWTAKQLVRGVLGEARAPHEIVVLSAPDGAPVVSVEGTPMFSLSISHAQRRAFCALLDGGALGADIEFVTPRSAGFIGEYFTAVEQSLVRDTTQRDLLITAIWSGKEAALKALHLGLTVDTRAVSCLIEPDSPLDWTPFVVKIDAERLHPSPSLNGWWRTMDGFVLTLVTDGQQTPLRRTGAG